MEKFYEPFIDESWNREYGENSDERKKNRRMNTTWTDPQKWVELFNLLLKDYKINNTVTNQPINIFNFENIELKHSFNIIQKSYLEIFKINMKIN